MKHSILFLTLFVLLFSTGYAQPKENVARECVLFELFTGVRCPYCPAAANAVAQLMEEGKAIAPVGYHTTAFSTADYYTNETNARASFYNISAYPTLIADGMLKFEGGGSASETNYSYYLARYNQRINQTSPFTIALTCEPGENGLWNVHCTVNQVGECSATNLKVMIALTQCNINVSWMGMQGLHHVCRDMIPNQQGTSFVGPTMTINESFLMNWPKQDCYLTAWVQNFSGNKEVYQAVRLPLDLNLDYDLMITGVKEYSPTNCSGMIKPTVSVSSYSNEEIHSFDAVAYNEGVEVYRETWNGTLQKGETADFKMSEFAMGDGSELVIKIENPNCHADEYQSDNTMAVTFETPVTIDGFLKMQAKSDQIPEENTVQIIDLATDEVLFEYTFDIPGQVYTEEMIILNAGCYRIRILDSASNGLVTGLFRFLDSDGNQIIRVNNTTEFTDEYTYEFSCDGTIAVNETASASMTLYPNPSQGRFFLDFGEGEWQVEIFDLTGRQVYQDRSFVKGDIELAGSGMYFLKARNGEKEIMRKVMVY